MLQCDNVNTGPVNKQTPGLWIFAFIYASCKVIGFLVFLMMKIFWYDITVFAVLICKIIFILNLSR